MIKISNTGFTLQIEHFTNQIKHFNVLIFFLNQPIVTITSTDCYKYFMNMYMKLQAAAAKE